MVRKRDDKIYDKKPSPFNGTGEILVRSLLNGEDEMYKAGRVFGHTTVYPGSAIGYHIHNGESETYYILSGTAKYNDNGVCYPWSYLFKRKRCFFDCRLQYHLKSRKTKNG